MAVRLTAALLALAAGVSAVALAALLLHDTPGPVSSAPAAPAAAAPQAVPRPTFPAPPAGAIVFSREDGPNALALALVPRGRRVDAQVSVVGQQGRGVAGLAVSVGSARTKSCGLGCYRATVPRPSAVEVRVGATRWRVVLPETWPAPDAKLFVAQAGRVWRSLRSLAFSDRLGSDANHVVLSEWRVVAPNRLAYRIRDGYQAVIVGGKRWDRAPHGRWIESAQTALLKQPVPVWQSATDAHVVVDYPGTMEITFFDPHTPAWFAIWVDKRSFTTLDLRMITTAHFMHERYRSWNRAPAITPPT